MAGSYRRKTTSGPNGTKRTVTQKQGGGVSSTTSHSAGTGQRTAYTRKANGSVVLTKTHRRADGYVTRETKTIVPKYKPVKHPKQPKMPKLKTTVLKEKTVRQRAPAATKIPKTRVKKVNWNLVFASSKTPRKRTPRSASAKQKQPGFFESVFNFVKVTFFIILALAVLSAIFGS
jgi:hypothetical protein